MSYSWAFVGTFTWPGSSIARIKRLVPPRLTSLDDLREAPTMLRDAIYAKESLVLRRLVDKSEYAEELVEVRTLMTKLAGLGASGSGALVSFIDGGPDAAGVAFELDGSQLFERALTTRKAVQVIVRSPPYRALVARCEQAFEEVPTAGPVPDADLRALIVGVLDRVPDAALLRAAKQAKLKLEVFEKGKGLQHILLLKLHPSAPSLRKALTTGSSEWNFMINAAPLALLSYVDLPRATDFARHVVDRGLGDRPQLARAVMPLLGATPFKDDFERLWRGFEHELPRRHGVQAAEAALIASSQPGVDTRVLAALRAEIGSPARWKANAEPKRTAALVEVLWRRDHAAGVQLILAAAKTHPDASSFHRAPQARGKHLDRWW